MRAGADVAVAGTVRALLSTARTMVDCAACKQPGAATLRSAAAPRPCHWRRLLSCLLVSPTVRVAWLMICCCRFAIGACAIEDLAADVPAGISVMLGATPRLADAKRAGYRPTLQRCFQARPWLATTACAKAAPAGCLQAPGSCPVWCVAHASVECLARRHCGDSFNCVSEPW